MRVPNISLYANATYNLGGLTGDLQNVNEVMATQKRINSISDDPIGLSQVLDLKTSIGNLDQIEKNVNMGISWLKGTENATDSVNDLILEAKTQVSRLINASMSASERRDAIEGIEGIIEQIVTLGNTQINGNYIFSGTDTDIEPLFLNTDGENPVVLYNGNENPFLIKTDKSVNVPVGESGREVFWQETVEINSTNNTIIFKEDNGHGSGSEVILEASVAFGEYDVRQLEQSIRNSLNDVSAKEGYGIVYDVEYDEDSRTFSIREDGSYDGYIRTEFMWESGADAYIPKVTASPSIPADDINLNVVDKDALSISTPKPHGSEPFRLTWQGDGTWAVDNNPGYVIYPFDISGTNDRIEIDLNESGMADIIVSLDTPAARGEYIEFDIVSAQGDHSIGHEIGFNADNTIYAPPTSDRQAVFITELPIVTGVNDEINFIETDSTVPVPVVTTRTITIPQDDYTDMDALANVIKTQMDAASLAGPNNVTYAVSYDAAESKFNIREENASLNIDQIEIDWAGSNAASTLGFYSQSDIISYPESDNIAQANIVINSTNNRIAFEETSGGVPSGVIWATIPEGTYQDMTAFEGAVATAMNTASAADGYGETYTASYEGVANNRFSIQAGGAVANLDLLWGAAGTDGRSIGQTLGYSPVDITGGGLGPFTGTNDMTLMTFDSSNNVIDFEEVSVDGTVTDEISITIPEGNYTELDDVAAEIQQGLRDASPHGVEYIVEYDAAGRFTIKGSDTNIKGFNLLWETGTHSPQSAGRMLGFSGNDRMTYSESGESVVRITIDQTNNKLNFKELLKGAEGESAEDLTAIIKWNDALSPTEKVYTSHSQLALEVEKALEEASYQNGNRIDYSVSWDDHTKNFSIKENGTRLAQFDLMWETGENAPLAAGGLGDSIGSILGFDVDDDIAAPVQSGREVEWGIFNSLIDLNEYLENNDTYGLERTLGRLESHYNSMTSQVVDIGIRYNRLEIRDKMTTETSLSLTERRSTIEDADFVKAVMDLESINTAYQASLNSTAKIVNLSLVDYL